MKPSSAKNKGRTLQKEIVADLLSIGVEHGLEADDCLSRGMGQQGVDVILSPRAREIFPFDIEAKNREALTVGTTFWDHWKKYAGNSRIKMLIHRRNRTAALVTLRWEDFLHIWKERLDGTK